MKILKRIAQLFRRPKMKEATFTLVQQPTRVGNLPTVIDFSEMAQVNPLNPKELRAEFGRDFTEGDIDYIYNDYQNSAYETRDFSIPLLWMDFPDEITKYDEARSCKYVELSYGGGENYRHVLGESNCEIVYRDYSDEIVQGCAYGISVAWNAYMLTKQYKTAKFVERNLSSITVPRLWIRQELDMLEEYLGTIDKPEYCGEYGHEWIEIQEIPSNYLKVFYVLPFLPFGRLAHIGSNPIFLYPTTHRQALLNCLDINFLRSWREKKELDTALGPAAQTTKRKNTHKI
jgi:hypothetical protein